ncbi:MULTISPECIES: hypothetical protein [unclassified Streptomyces]|uniref:hypothetical protein n=1 Tax=unclassified Streptomyces TaxID=2593676 RepID=UPI001F207BEC|nr:MULTISPECIES: hypothetical protein [unclassified Streptomyces]
MMSSDAARARLPSAAISAFSVSSSSGLVTTGSISAARHRDTVGLLATAHSTATSASW